MLEIARDEAIAYVEFLMTQASVTEEEVNSVELIEPSSELAERGD